MTTIVIDIEERATVEAQHAAKELFNPENLLSTLRQALRVYDLREVPADLKVDIGDYSEEQRKCFRSDLKELQELDPSDAPTAINVSWVELRSNHDSFGEDNFTLRLQPEGNFAYVGCGVEV